MFSCISVEASVSRESLSGGHYTFINLSIMTSSSYEAEIMEVSGFSLFSLTYFVYNEIGIDLVGLSEKQYVLYRPRVHSLGSTKHTAKDPGYEVAKHVHIPSVALNKC